MPNYEDESRYPRQRSSPGSQQSGGQSPQQPLILGTQPEAANNESPYPLTGTRASGVLPVVRHASGSTVAAQQIEDEGSELIHYILIGIDIFLVVACIFAFIKLLQQLMGATTNFSVGNLLHLLLLFTIFGASVGGGFLLGRYRNNTLAHQENLRLSGEITLLKGDAVRAERENAGLKQQIRSLQSAAVPPAIASSSMVGAAAPLRPIQPIQAPPSIYDNPREPDDRSDLPFHPHEKIFPGGNEQNSLLHGWRIVGASRRGYGHAYEGKYREDDFNIKLFSFSNSRQHPGADIALVAIADGVGSKELSRRGARAAVLGATNPPQERLRSLKAYLGKDTGYEHCREEAYYLLVDAVTAARLSVEECIQRNKVSIEDLQSTLLVFLAAPWDEQRILIASTQIGDGVLFSLQPSQGQAPRQKWGWLQKPQIGGAGNEVKPFMRATAEEWRNFFQFDLLDSAAGCIMGMTDGTADDIEPPRATTANRDPDPFLLVDDFYQRIILPSFSNTQAGEALVKLLGYRKKQSFDDRTVVYVYHH